MLLVCAAAFDMLFHPAPTAWHSSSSHASVQANMSWKGFFYQRHAILIRSIRISMHAVTCVNDGSSATCRLAYGHGQPAGCSSLLSARHGSSNRCMVAVSDRGCEPNTARLLLRLLWARCQVDCARAHLHGRHVSTRQEQHGVVRCCNTTDMHTTCCSPLMPRLAGGLGAPAPVLTDSAATPLSVWLGLLAALPAALAGHGGPSSALL
jgi:hypothetical protein